MISRRQDTVRKVEGAKQWWIRSKEERLSRQTCYLIMKWVAGTEVRLH
jgi:hypothetical protein